MPATKGIVVHTQCNWFSGLRAAHPPLNKYLAVIGGCDYPYGDYTGRGSVGVQAYSYYHNFVGNVLGMSKQQLLTNSYAYQSCFAPAETEFLDQVTTDAQWTTTASNANAVVLWQFGAYQATVNSTGNWGFVDSTINTQTRNGNWDWYTQAQTWYGTGGITGGGATPVTIPNSFYLSSKPAFFGSQTWPWVDPTTGTTYTLPAMYCFQQNMMPTCLQ
jgi:hypothetical protein